MIQQARFTCSPLRKFLDKYIKAIDDQGKKLIKATEDHGKEMIESNELIKNDFISTEITYHMKNKKIFNELIKESLPNFEI